MLCCALLGGLLFGAERRLAPPEPLAVPANAPDEALLAREAERLGLGRGDAVVQDAFLRWNDFLGAGDPRSAAELFGRDGDPALRRHLAGRLAARIRAEAAAEPVDEQTLRSWYEAERGRFAIPALVRLVQVFFAGPDAEARAARARGRIERDALDPVRAAALGDPSLFGAELAPIAEAPLAARFGTPLASAAFAAPVGSWVGPVLSSHGAHLLFVRERREARDAGFAAARGAIESAWRTEHGEAALAAALARLRAESERSRG